jgi:putative membrane protein
VRYLKWAWLACLAIVLLIVAIANSGDVTLRLLPGEIGDFAGFSWSIELPLFLVIFIGIAAGLMIGFVWEWFREHKHRIEATRQGREARKLQREVEALKSDKRKSRGEDDVLALLDDAR